MNFEEELVASIEDSEQVWEEKQKQLDRVYKYHKPNPDSQEKFNKIRSLAKELAEFVTFECPESREQSVALTKIEEAVMWANASVARPVVND